MTPVDRCIKFAVVGCGHIGKRHAEMITRHAGSKLVAVAHEIGQGPEYNNHGTTNITDLSEVFVDNLAN